VARRNAHECNRRDPNRGYDCEMVRVRQQHLLTHDRIVRGCLCTGFALLTLGNMAMAVYACLNSLLHDEPIEAILTASAGVAIACHSLYSHWRVRLRLLGLAG